MPYKLHHVLIFLRSLSLLLTGLSGEGMVRESSRGTTSSKLLKTEVVWWLRTNQFVQIFEL